MALVAAAGPITNFVVAFVALFTLVLMRRMLVETGLTDGATRVLLLVFQFNLALGIFNLLPLPPLDGGHFLAVLGRGGAWLATLEQYGPMLLLVLVVSGATRYVIGPVFEALTSVYVAVLRLIF